MAKFNTGTVATAPRSRRGSTPLKAETKTPNARTHEGGLAHTFAPMTELFQMLTGSFVAEDGFYEKGNDRVARVRALVEKITKGDTSEGKADSGLWFMGFTKWLRTQAFIRTGAVVLAAEVAHARIEGKHAGFTRDVVAAALDRADEPGELIGYWLAQFGKPIPTAVKRGVADATIRLYTEYSTLKYDTASHALRFGDIVEIVNPRTNARASAGPRNDALFRHLIDRRHDYNTSPIPESLAMLRARAELDAVPLGERRAILTGAPDRLKAAGMTWENIAGWLQGPMDAAAWQVAINGMGYMALLRNLRNFDEAGIDKKVATKVAARLADPEQVAKSRQLPFRFWTAYREVANDRWKVALGDALDLATQNIPDALGGRTLVLTDTSGSMQTPLSDRSSVRYQEVGGLFAIAMAMKFGPENVDLVEFASTTQLFPLRKGASVLTQVEAFNRTNGRVGHGTDIVGAVRASYKGHDRVVLISDMQTFGGYGRGAGSHVPADIPFYAFNLAGHSTTVLGNTPNRFQLGGLNDKTFGWMEQVERGKQVGWPWETAA